MTTRIHYSSRARANPGGLLRTGPLGRAFALIAGGVVLVAGLFVSALVFSVLLVVGVVAGGWFWWKTRNLRKELGERMAQMQRMQGGGRRRDGPDRASPGDVLDGDFISETERPDAVKAGHATPDGASPRR